MEVSSFTSKYDYTFKGMAKLTKAEQRGYALFRGKGTCHSCHSSNGKEALFTDFTYDNLGVPKNPDNPFYTMPEIYNPDGANWVDGGLGGFLKSAGYSETIWGAEWGKQKVPTLRNVALGSCEAEPDNSDCIVKAYGHNGYFKSLEEIVHFYNTRDVPGAAWPDPEVAENVNTGKLGDLGLTPGEEADIVAFLKTLSDGYMP